MLFLWNKMKRESLSAPFLVFSKLLLFLKVTVIKSLEALAVTGFIARHFMDRIVDGIVIHLFRPFRNPEFIVAGT